MLKAVKEAKLHTSWLTPNQAYEDALSRFVERVLKGPGASRFLSAFLPFQQRLAAPALQGGGELPAQVARVLQPGVDAVAAVGRMAVRGVAGNEQSARAVVVGDGEAQVPEADVLELHFERRAHRFVEEGLEVEVVGGGAGRHRWVV